MPTYQAKAPLSKHGKYIAPGEKLELTVEQAKKLGDKVAMTQVAKLEDKTVEELKDIAKAKSVKDYSSMKQDELIKAITEAK
jgi:Rho termination factor, N-terminal domain